MVKKLTTSQKLNINLMMKLKNNAPKIHYDYYKFNANSCMPFANTQHYELIFKSFIHPNQPNKRPTFGSRGLTTGQYAVPV